MIMISRFRLLIVGPRDAVSAIEGGSATSSGGIDLEASDGDSRPRLLLVTAAVCSAMCRLMMSAAREVEFVFELVKELTELPGPTGHEDAVQDWIERRWSEFAQDVRRTRVNNILARVGGTGPRLLLVAHADEICLMVKSVTDEGFLHLWPYYSDQLGRPPRWFTPLNQPALVLSSAGAVPGVFATASGHVVGGRNSQKEQFEWNDWFVDIGARSCAEVETPRYRARRPGNLESGDAPHRKQHHRQGDGRSGRAGDRHRRR